MGADDGAWASRLTRCLRFGLDHETGIDEVSHEGAHRRTIEARMVGEFGAREMTTRMDGVQ